MKKIQNPIKICLRLRKFLIFRWLDMGEHGRELLLSAPSVLQLYCTCIDLSCWRRMQDAGLDAAMVPPPFFWYWILCTQVLCYFNLQSHKIKLRKSVEGTGKVWLPS